MATPAVTSLKNALFSVNVMEQLQNALGKRAEAFATSFLELVTSNTDLQGCTANALVMEALKAATLDLPLNKALGYAYVVPFKNKKAGTVEPQLIISYKGITQLAYRTCKYEVINNGCVYEGELQETDKLSGTFNINGKRTSDKVVGYFAYFKMTNGLKKMLYMSVEEMAAYALRYSKGLVKFENGHAVKFTLEEMIAKANMPAPEYNAVGWANNFESMALKTVLRRLLMKWGELAIDNKQSDILDSIEKRNIEDNQPMVEEVDTFDVYPEAPKAIEASATKAVAAEEVKEEAVAADAIPFM